MKQTAITIFVILYSLITNAQVIIFENISIISPNLDRVQTPRDVLIRDGIIEKIDVNLRSPKNAKKIDGTGKFLMAGMADMHVHLPDPNRDIISTRHFLLLQLLAGVTTVRSMRGNERHISLRDSLRKNMILSPNLYLSAPPFYSTQRVPADSLHELIYSYKAAGFDFLKILSLPNSRTFYDSLLIAANRLGMHVSGHAPWGDIEIALENRQKSIEHLQGYASLNESRLTDAIQKTKDNEIYNCPTLDWTFVGSLYYPIEELRARSGMEFLPTELKKKWDTTLTDYLGKVSNEERNKDSLSLITQLNIIKKLKEAKCNFLLSQDASNVFQVPGFGLVEEMKLFLKAGFSNQEILTIATQNPARYFDQQDHEGKVEVGFKANLVVLSANPLEDIENVRKVEGVLVEKKWLTRQYLENEIKKHLK